MRSAHSSFKSLMRKGNAAILVLLFILLVGGIGIIYFGDKHKFFKQEQIAESRQELTQSETGSDVLSHSDSVPRLFISGGENNYGVGGLVSLASTAEPVVEIGSYNTTGIVNIELYQANEEALINYLLHNDENQQLTPTPDINNLALIASFDHEITSGYGKASRLELPLSEFGIWALKMTLNNVTEYGFIVRSRTGVLVKEGAGELILWGQNYSTRRRVNDGEVRVYNLQNRKTEIDYSQFDSEGIARTLLSPKADVAIARFGDDGALIPINLKNLNSSYKYQPFTDKQLETKYFVFTDRPLYRPGDTVYFKAIIRDDDDARYTVPSGAATVKVYRNWDEKETIFERTYSITDVGTVYGEMTLPENVKTDSYTLKVEISDRTTSDSWSYWANNRTSFQVQHFRKPEYSIDITAGQREYIKGETIVAEVNGNYFSGQPLAGQQVKYKAVSSDFYEYTYFNDLQPSITDDYRYGYWGGKTVWENVVTLDSSGKGIIEIPTADLAGSKSQIISIEAQFDDGSGNPSFARKNLLVYAGDFGIYREDRNYHYQTNQPLTFTAVLVPYRQAAVGGIKLAATVKRSVWVSYQQPEKKYQSYRKEADLPDLTAVTDSSGKAGFSFTPDEAGSYAITVTGIDARGNTVSKVFHFWVTDKSKPMYTGEHDNELTLVFDKEKYLPTDTARMTISSLTPDRDIFISFERGRLNRYQIIALNGTSATVDLPLEHTDMPNIFIEALSFSSSSLDKAVENVIVSTDNRRLNVMLTPDRTTYGPGDTVTVNVSTTDTAGNPLSANAALWAVDKALFELVPESKKDIFEHFWRERYDSTFDAHSLQGISVQSAEMGGGCFAADTPVLLDDGTRKPIAEIKVGDKVTTRISETDPRLSTATVTGTHKREVAGYFVINNSLKITSNHYLWVNDSWRMAGDIVTGDILRDTDNREIEVESIYWQLGKFTVYNLEIADKQTFFAGGVWVHNQKGRGVRDVFKDTAYWNPSVTTDNNGRAQISFILPDNLTTWVIAGVGATVDTVVGQTTQEIVVSKDVIVRPILPNILRVDDEVVLSALVHNFTDNDYTFDVDLHFDSGIVEMATHSGQRIAAKGTEQLYWKIKPDQENEKAQIRVSARARENDKAVDTIIKELPVREFGFWEKTAQTGIGATNYSLSLQPHADTEKSEVKLTLSPTLIGTLPTAMSYLVNYPYGCVEQTTSRFVPAIIAKSHPALFADVLKDKDVDEIVKKSISRLSFHQNSDGGWGWWGRGRSDVFVTAYVVEYLLKARELGADVDDSMLEQVREFFINPVSVNTQTGETISLTREDKIVRTYALSLFGEGSEEKISDFNGLSPDILAMAVMANVHKGFVSEARQGAQLLEQMAQSQGDGVYWEGGSKVKFGSRDASTAFAIRALVSVQSERDIIVKAVQYLTRNRRSNYWSNSFATAQVIQAVTDFSQTGEELSPNYSYSVFLDGRQIAQGSVTDSTQKIADIDIPVASIKPGSTVTINHEGIGQLYSTLILNQFITDKNAAAVDNGLMVKREYINDKGADYTLGVGDTVMVKIILNGLGAEEMYGVIEDELPAGLVPINRSFLNEQYGRDYKNYYSASGISDQEITENGVVMSLYRVGTGLREYTYKARVVSEGVYSVPPVTATLMYAPEINGRSAAETITIGRASVQIPGTKQKVSEEVREVRFLDMLYRNRWPIGAGVIVLVALGVVIIKIYRRRRGKPQTPVNIPKTTTAQSPEASRDNREML